MSKIQIGTGCVEMTGPDTKWTNAEMPPANPLPVKCSHCTFPNLDSIPQSCVLTKGVSSPSEISATLESLLGQENLNVALQLVLVCSWQFSEQRKGLLQNYEPSHGKRSPTQALSSFTSEDAEHGFTFLPGTIKRLRCRSLSALP